MPSGRLHRPTTVAAFFILIGASFIVYMLMTQAGDPLAFTLADHQPDAAAGGDRTPSPRPQPRQSPIERYFTGCTGCCSKATSGSCR
jgi:hypothetical protein